MIEVIEPLTDVGQRARRRGLEIVLIVTGAPLLRRLTSWAGGGITKRIDANAQERDGRAPEASRHRHALAQVATWATLAAI